MCNFTSKSGACYGNQPSTEILITTDTECATTLIFTEWKLGIFWWLCMTTVLDNGFYFCFFLELHTNITHSHTNTHGTWHLIKYQLTFTQWKTTEKGTFYVANFCTYHFTAYLGTHQSIKMCRLTFRYLWQMCTDSKNLSLSHSKMKWGKTGIKYTTISEICCHVTFQNLNIQLYSYSFTLVRIIHTSRINIVLKQ